MFAGLLPTTQWYAVMQTSRTRALRKRTQRHVPDSLRGLDYSRKPPARKIAYCPSRDTTPACSLRPYLPLATRHSLQCDGGNIEDCIPVPPVITASKAVRNHCLAHLETYQPEPGQSAACRPSPGSSLQCQDQPNRSHAPGDITNQIQAWDLHSRAKGLFLPYGKP